MKKLYADRSFWIWSSLLSFLCVLVWSGCGEASTDVSSESTSEADAVVARVGDRDITVDAIQRIVDQSKSAMTAEEALNKIRQDIALLEWAERLGIYEDPEVRGRIDRLIMGELKARQLEPALAQLTASEDDLNRFYQAHAKDFYKSKRCRVAILVAANRNGQAQSRIETALDSASEVPAEKGFGALALRASDDRRSRFDGGDVGWVMADRYPENVNQVLLDIAFAMETPGQTSEAIELEDGWGAVRLIAVRQGYQPDLKSLTPSLRSMILRKKREDLTQAYFEEALKLSNFEWVQAEQLQEIKSPKNSDAAQELRPPALP